MARRSKVPGRTGGACGAGGGGRNARGSDRRWRLGREKAAGKGRRSIQRLECEANAPLLQLPSFTEDLRWQASTADFRGDAEPRPLRGLPRQVEGRRPVHQRDVRPQLRRGFGDLQPEVLRRDGAHPHHRTGGQEAEREAEGSSRPLKPNRPLVRMNGCSKRAASGPLFPPGSHRERPLPDPGSPPTERNGSGRRSPPTPRPGSRRAIPTLPGGPKRPPRRPSGRTPTRSAGRRRGRGSAPGARAASRRRASRRG